MEIRGLGHELAVPVAGLDQDRDAIVAGPIVEILPSGQTGIEVDVGDAVRGLGYLRCCLRCVFRLKGRTRLDRARRSARRPSPSGDHAAGAPHVFHYGPP